MRPFVIAIVLAMKDLYAEFVLDKREMEDKTQFQKEFF